MCFFFFDESYKSTCRAKAKLVYACDWNPYAIKALQHNVHANSVANQCIILEGDNHITAPKVSVSSFPTPKVIIHVSLKVSHSLKLSLSDV